MASSCQALLSLASPSGTLLLADRHHQGPVSYGPLMEREHPLPKWAAS